MELYSVLWSMEYGPKKMELNGRLLMSMLALYESNKDSIVKVTPSKLKTFVLILSKMFVILRFIAIKTWKLYIGLPGISCCRCMSEVFHWVVLLIPCRFPMLLFLLDFVYFIFFLPVFPSL